MQKAQQAYLQTQVTTTSQGELVVMLYDGAIKFLQQAKEKMAEKNYAEKGILISKSLDIIAELDSSLNIEKGGELSNNLHSLYLYSQGRLLQANMKMDQEIVDEVLKILSSLRGAFAAIINTPEAIEAQKQAPEQAPVNVSTFRKAMPFGLESGAEKKQVAQPGLGVANNSTRARAYQQQAAAFSPQLRDQAGGPVTPAVTTGPEESKIFAQGVDGEIPAAKLTPAATTTASPDFLAGTPITPQPAQPAQPAQSVQAVQPAQTVQVTQPDASLTPAQAGGAAGLTGFGRQMINNSLYKKMAMSPTAPQATLAPVVGE